MAFTQSNRQLQVKTPLGPDELLILKMEAREELGRLYEFTVDLLSDNESISADDLLGKKMTVEMDMVNTTKRYFDGYVSRFTQIGHMAFFAHYRATLRPWFWLLTQTSDCRIFQNKTVPDIVKEVFGENGFSDFEERLSGSYREWEYCVQYRETDFNFVSRLLEQEGIYYFFKHEAGKHTLVLCDDYGSHRVLEAYSEIPYLPPTEAGSSRFRDYIHSWRFSKSVRPGKYVHTDYDFKKPKSDLLRNALQSRSHSYAEYEIYDYPGEYEVPSDGEGYAKHRIQELQAGHEVLEGKGNARGVTTGGLFTMTEHPRGDQNREYLITGASYSLHADAFESVAEIAQGPLYVCEFSCMDSKEIFRTARTTPKPMVQGPQTAVVVGPAGEEIYTDEYGRVKLHFHWDRYDSRDENSSCWVRVAQVWAGKNWGAMHIPRIGQEVIVDFLEGDPDRPIVTGRVYNADQMPPYGLPANMTQSGIKSRSTKGGSGDNFNEIRFEDKKGNEQLYVHAEKNQDNIVENNETTSVGNDRTENVGHDETITIANDRTESVGNNESITIGVNRTETVGSNESVSIGSNRSVNIGSNKSETVGVNKAETIGAAKALTIGAGYQVSVGAGMNETVGASKSMQIASSLSETVGSDRAVSVGKNQATTIGDSDTLTVGKNLVIEAGDSVTIKTGKASITMKKDGTIAIQGKDITVKGSGGVDVKASKNVVIKGKKVLQN
ncbi:MAG: type VI secretion system tip protein VgrG [Candidatus Thiodiazotropha sp. (ex Ctena orbiculata)]|uniref:Type VI secretion system tip protein VgrG n=1 Tax=Candidatus Thiodiazotropha taylori TaxID=2792791 RepID=A0A944MA07_9GAMM|nr:type VI secretion system tip protein VgrG [Candidatus Thiodiazotropha taylori]MBT3027561.1 type VI secretion system tip protein VgrG [Candidatus Thiodiazotropha taylori]MBT3034976.1 type VI secretion system tip protein VgrG [Candidatus Thiodiazotropha taylori]MBV2139077.1 type VI secretion system tip protein VgrG [Candidatus Thiodiazotropha taylori]